MASRGKINILYSFPLRIGAGRICSTAYHQVCGVADASHQVTVHAASYARQMPSEVSPCRSLSMGGLRVPVKLIGRWHACLWHDWLTARWLKRHGDQIDVFHGWPLGSLHTMRVARSMGIPCFLERPNTHTAFAYQTVAEENARLGMKISPGHDHAYSRINLEREEQEYEIADYLLCPSDFVKMTFHQRGFPEYKLLRHQYGYDDAKFQPGDQDPEAGRGLVVLYAGVGVPRKGLHYALRAWNQSGAHERGSFLICGKICPSYLQKLTPLIKHPSVQLLGERTDLAELMKLADVLILSSIEEGSALVTYEARGSGCVLLVSEASGAVCEHMIDSLVHPVGDVDTLAAHISLVDADRRLLARLREGSLSKRAELTWGAAGCRLKRAYEDALAAVHPSS